MSGSPVKRLTRSSSSRLDTFESQIEARRRLSNADSRGTEVDKLRDDLLLSAQVGQALVQENSELKEQLKTTDAARDQLLDRLAASYKDNAVLERRLESQTTALDTSEASNRALLAALEEDRKTHNKLAIEHTRLSSIEKRFKSLVRERDDLRQEADAQARRAAAAESRASKAAARLAELDGRSPPSAPFVESPLSSPRMELSSQRVSLNSNRRRSTDSASYRSSMQDLSASAELLRAIGTLSDENAELKNHVAELQRLLSNSQEHNTSLKEEMEHQDMDLSDNFTAESSFRRSIYTPLSPSLHSPSPSVASFESGQFAYTLPDGSTKPQSSRRRRSGQRPATMMLPSALQTKRKHRSIDMSTLYDQISNIPSRPNSPVPLEPILDNSPVQSRTSSSELRSEPPDSPTRRRHASPTTTTTTGPYDSDVLVLTRDMSAQTDDVQQRRMPAESGKGPALSVSDMGDAHAHFPGDVLADTQGTERTMALGVLLDKVTRLLARIKAADIATLEARLKKQRLPGGDVGHLSKSTLKDILSEVEGLRESFRKILEQERSGKGLNIPGLDLSLLTQDQNNLLRKDFVQLVKVFKDSLAELGRLRSIINRVQIDPALGHKIAELDTMAAYEEAPALAPAKGILAPLSKLFYSASPEAPKRTASHGAAKASPLRAVTDVEFDASSSSQHNPQQSVMPPKVNRSPSRAGLRSIFAGGRTLPRDPWQVVSAAPRERQQANTPVDWRRTVLSPQNDAVLDSFHQPHNPDEFQPSLLDRTLHKRGLSDSSIHSTFISHANPAALTPARLALSVQTSEHQVEDLQATLSTSSCGGSSNLTSPEMPTTPADGASLGTSPRPILVKPSPEAGTLFSTLSSWAAFSPLASAVAFENSRLQAVSQVSGTAHRRRKDDLAHV